MLSKTKYSFNKIDRVNLPDDKVFMVFGDNLLESMQIVKWLAEFNSEKMKFLRVEYLSFSKFIYVYEINGQEYYFICSAYYRDGRIPDEVRLMITNMDKPDAIIYSPSKKKVIMGFESTSSTLAGNATWQRTGRTIYFLKSGIPFAFLAYASKIDQSDVNPGKKPRTPSNIFVLLYLILSMKYLTPALAGFFEHSDPKQSIGIKRIADFRADVFKYTYSLLFEPNDSKNKLRKCFENMCKYYEGDNVPTSEFSSKVRNKILDPKFIEELLFHMENEYKTKPLFDEESIKIFDWKPKGISDQIAYMFPDIEIFQLSKYCKAGICYDTRALVRRIDEKNSIYSSEYLRNLDQPTVIIPIKLTKTQNGVLIPTDDPYNGEISAFSELYLQSYPKANVMILLIDHTNANEYDVDGAKTRKIYKSITNYASIVIDMDLKIFDPSCNQASREGRNRYEQAHVTEDAVTCFFETILMTEGIEPSFINPPCGSWSDMRLYPTDMFYYYKRNDERADIAFYKLGVYYIGESKDTYASLKPSIERELAKVKKIENILKENLNMNVEYQSFCIFYGNRNEAINILQNSTFNYAIYLSETSSKIEMEIIER